ncbi:MAG: 30S ribosomal protein S6 [bacterium]|nr:30S ribosomal protein S6 [bacterium]
MKYELLYIIPATIADDELSSVEGSVSALLEKHGAQTIESTRLGKLRFAYPINKTRYGHYTLVHFDAEGESMAKIDMELRILNTVLRYIVLKQEDTSKKPFTLVQFTEVNVDSKEVGRRRKKSSDDETEKPAREEISSGVKAIEGDETAVKEDVVEEKKEDAPALTDQELEKKLDDVLTKDEKEA